ncbi:unnamed protein product, partial [Callosobruchus maculatus]
DNGSTISTSPVLLLDDLRLKHEGAYTCLASNRLGNSTLTYHLTVLQRPYFQAVPSSRSYPVAMRARLECRAGGRPQPKIRWYKDGEPLEYNNWLKKPTDGWLFFSTTFSKDSGIYQCVATNSVGNVWTAVQMEIINVSQIPSPPENLTCRPYNETSICLEWNAPKDVPVVKAYTVHTFYKANGAEVSLPEYVTNITYQQAEGLNSSTNYTFYLRLYSNAASDHTQRVTCRTGVTGNRNLEIESTKPNTVILKWSEISTDVACDGFRDMYSVQWRNEGHTYTERTSEHTYEISDLIPGVDYEFRVISGNREDDSTSWIPFTLQDNTTSDGESNGTTLEPPRHLDGEATSTSTVRLFWDATDNQVKYYVVCYVQVKSDKDCEDGKIVKSTDNKLQISKLKPNTKYEFRVRAHDQKGNPGRFSRPKEIQTQHDVPSPIQNLGYSILNTTAACVHWRPPARKDGGRLLSYMVSYTPDPTLPVNRWIDLNVPVARANQCWFEEEDSASIVLANLTIDTGYLLFVRAVSDVGVGQPIVPITLSLLSKPQVDIEEQPNEHYHKTIGIVLGTLTSLLCVVVFILCILARRRCLKRAVNHQQPNVSGAASRLIAPTSSESPTVARYTANRGVRFDATTPKEVELLVGAEDDDDRGGAGESGAASAAGAVKTKTQQFSNGHADSLDKPISNGHVPSNHIHITENPQYCDVESNGRPAFPTSEPSSVPHRFEEDSNSNVRSSKLYDFYRFFENHRGKKPRVRNDSYTSQIDGSPNVTQITCLDESLDANGVNNNRRMLPLLEPNG